jgi:hypothetical protein
MYRLLGITDRMTQQIEFAAILTRQLTTCFICRLVLGDQCVGADRTITVVVVVANKSISILLLNQKIDGRPQEKVYTSIDRGLLKHYR